ncbi:putative fatty acyl-CoA reductase CG5065 [Diorhabda carinulata]|uniref:putative fatty acyl-CoA reductase CG5065 n=1 Tax=Diorhabda carinulata TaxID=1163345 RepID=UPI0025A04621|nr:putative fatty acyl-CoA reductase CG5065 [Diorhabda carinulata]XP_057672432.1 putative fatty acyl-CoA reductase CG5065 [Diorhabda carinulata]XP_057672433.1 putative fatty acyl-CoA reductase CG5065 [Diorhabda carinulata]XP_057672434.1 putative fatty acyl-CoA reductase CG5065 [Diorhabda carinulata]
MTEEIDRIAQIFNGSVIFLTGATGLVGKSLIEKLLRLTEVKKIYILIRSKKGKSPTERIKDLFNNPLFHKLLNKKPEAIEKCIPIRGDVSLPMLGISEVDRQKIIEEADFIIHSAATVRFDDSLKYAVTVNTRGTKFVLELAEECKKLKLFVHVSTAYAFPNNTDGITYEKEYPPPADPHEVLSSINWLNDDILNEDLTKRLLGNIPNTYTFSKGLSEALVYEKVGKIPLIICRPAIIIPAFKDPVPGWTNNLQGPSGLFVGAGKGVIRTVYMDTSCYANFSPIDCTVSAIMVFSWYHLTTNNPNYIYNLCIPQKDLQISWEEIFATAKDVIHNDCPFNLMLWYPEGTITKSRLYNKINTILFQLLPALILDLILLIAGQKPQFWSIQNRILNGMKMYEFYTIRKWDFETTQIEKIREVLNTTEKDHYQLEDKEKDVRKYLKHCILYLRRHYFKETDDMLPAARRNMKIMYCLDKLVKFIFIGLAFYYIFYKTIFQRI